MPVTQYSFGYAFIKPAWECAAHLQRLQHTVCIAAAVLPDAFEFVGSENRKAVRLAFMLL